MHFPYTALLLASSSLFSSISALPSNRHGPLLDRTDPDCSKPVVQAISKRFQRYPSFASKICSTILHRPSPATVTATSTNTITEPTTLTGETTTTVASGISTISTTTTTTTTTVATVLSTTTTAPIITVISSSTVTTTATVPGTTPATSTTTVTVYTHPAEMRKRSPSRKIGQVYPGSPKDLGNIALDIASTVCGCFLGPVVTPSTTITVTATSTNTINGISTRTATVPSTTTTGTETIIVTDTSSTTSVTTVTNPSTITITAIATTTATTSTPVATPVTTSTVTISNSYQNVGVPSTRCVYNEYYSYVSANNDPANNYRAGIEGCKDLCDRDPRCRFFMYYRSDPAFRNQGDTSAYCIIDETPYHSDVLQCNVPFVLYDVGYNKV